MYHTVFVVVIWIEHMEIIAKLDNYIERSNICDK